MESKMFFFFPSDEVNETCDFLRVQLRVSAYCNKYFFVDQEGWEMGDFLILYSNKFWTGPNQSRMLSINGVERHDTKKPTALCMMSIPSNIEGLFDKNFVW